MAMRLVVNGKEVTNPFARAIVWVVAIAVAILVLAIALPLIGITFAISLGVFLGLFAALLLILLIGYRFHRPNKPNEIPLDKPKDR
jgi:ABC-type transport system involved in cytochrome bd biosynthesis fused ATPase/permease subunit